MKLKAGKMGRHVVAGCMFVGMGAGYLVDQLAAGLFLGLGVGYLLQMFSSSRESGEQ